MCSNDLGKEYQIDSQRVSMSASQNLLQRLCLDDDSPCRISFHHKFLFSEFWIIPHSWAMVFLIFRKLDATKEGTAMFYVYMQVSYIYIERERERYYTYVCTTSATGNKPASTVHSLQKENPIPKTSDRSNARCVSLAVEPSKGFCQST